ncbi:sensor histidine kinase [Thermogemmatispora carboxidivorans]|uniref:sensor histidine kinase n=1 Tax=Thermogemmatispora carboxidivorans TaxID=1382306 RepID=UPI00069A5AEC|nr:HAMP domain-containing sensor histidine kinase [Thermogemmatispora carboxidivorans]
MSYRDRSLFANEATQAERGTALQRELLTLLPALTTAPPAEVAAALLQALRETTAAEHGAFFLHWEASHPATEVPRQVERLQLLAAQRLDEEQARALVSVAGSGSPLTTASSDAGALPLRRSQVQTAEAVWLLLSLPLVPSRTETGRGPTLARPALVVLLGRGGQPASLADWLAESTAIVTTNQQLLAALLRQALLTELLAGAGAGQGPPASASLATPIGPQSELLATLSHELRSPLAVIRAAVSTLLRHERRLPLAERRLLLESAQTAGEHLIQLCDRFLELSELEAGLLHLEPTAVDPLSVVHEALLAAEQRLPPEQANAFSFQVMPLDASGSPTEGVPLVLADRRRLREILDHLLENAVRFSPEGGEIRVILRPQAIPATGEAQPAPAVEICVSDQGRGIPPEQLPQIFQRFYRGDSGLARQTGGLGLGLALCRYLAELQGGQIWAESESGQGSTFHLLLPALTGPQPQPLTSSRLV